MNNLRLLIFLIVIAFVASCGSKELRVTEYQLPPETPNPAKPTDEFYVIGAGDALGILVWKEPSLSGPVKVRPDGFITLPLINEVRAVGLSTAALRKILEEKYKEYVVSPFVTIRVEGISSSEVFMIGQVNRPGSYPLNKNDSILQLLTRAGGLTIFAKRKKIRVVRRDDQKVTEYTIGYNAIIKGDLKQDILLRPGDRVIVP